MKTVVYYVHEDIDSDTYFKNLKNENDEKVKLTKEEKQKLTNAVYEVKLLIDVETGKIIGIDDQLLKD